MAFIRLEVTRGAFMAVRAIAGLSRTRWRLSAEEDREQRISPHGRN
jgi:hypothetical protein